MGWSKENLVRQYFVGTFTEIRVPFRTLKLKKQSVFRLFKTKVSQRLITIGRFVLIIFRVSRDRNVSKMDVHLLVKFLKLGRLKLLLS